MCAKRMNHISLLILSQLFLLWTCKSIKKDAYQCLSDLHKEHYNRNSKCANSHTESCVVNSSMVN